MHHAMECILGGLSTSCACVFSNPLEVVKTRMQLQGELQARGSYKIHYRNVFHAFYTIGRVDGIRALQKGLLPGICYQAVMNGFRLGNYQAIQNAGLMRTSDGTLSYFRCMAAGAVSGCIGAFFGSPMYMIKTHLQSEATASIAVGAQHHYKGLANAISAVLQEHGIRGLWRGVTGAMPRVSVGSAAQLSSFSKSKEMISKRGIFKKDSIMIPLSASMVGSIFVVMAMTPFDVVSTRLYNQDVSKSGKGTLYNGFFDCASKIFKKEGFIGFYKGLGASYFRLGPHTVFSLVFWDKFRSAYLKFSQQN
eukprot:gene15113-16669_t